MTDPTALTEDESDWLWYAANRRDLSDDTRRVGLETVVETLLTTRLQANTDRPHPGTMIGRQ